MWRIRMMLKKIRALLIKAKNNWMFGIEMNNQKTKVKRGAV